MEPFKNLYNKKSITELAKEIKKHYPKFAKEQFVTLSCKKLSALEMKDRVVQICQALREHLPDNYKKSAKILVQTSKNLDGFILWPLTQYVESYGLEDFETSLETLYHLTQKFTGEFAIRPFLENHPKQTYALLNKWVSDPNVHVRRLVSEGTRPNLPWGIKVSTIEKNLKKNIALLNKLKDDPEEYVRKSVANHMNDITRVDDKLALRELEKWNKSKNKNRQWIIRHALRSLLKAGDKKALELQGYCPKVKIQCDEIHLSKKTIVEGESFDMHFNLKNLKASPAKLMVDYIIHYPKKNAQLSPKVFKLKTLSLGPHEQETLRKKISFKKVTTRKHYPGKHIIEIQVNGQIINEDSFMLKQ